MVEPSALPTLQGFSPGENCSDTPPISCFRLKRGLNIYIYCFYVKPAINLALRLVLTLVTKAVSAVCVEAQLCQLSKTRAEDVFVSKELMVCDGTSSWTPLGMGGKQLVLPRWERHKFCCGTVFCVTVL